MLRSMYAGVSGLKAHQNMMDVIGNNIANVNTTGFKSSRVNFKEMLNQTLSGASAPQDGKGGVNPKQIGLGVNIGSIDTNMGQGSLESTGKMTDVAIQGNGFFVVSDGSRNLFTRAGNLSFDKAGYLVNSSTGNRVQGWTEGSNPDTDPLEGIQLDSQMAAKNTESITTEGNIDNGSSSLVLSTSVYDSQGGSHDVTINLNKISANEWSLGAVNVTDTSTSNATMTNNIQFDGDGNFDTGGNLTITFDPNGGAATGQTINVDFSELTQYAGDTTADVDEVDGYPRGDLKDFTVNDSGAIIGSYDNGYNKTIAHIGVANFANASGLMKEGETMFSESNNSGAPQYGLAGSEGRGSITTGAIEMSNVDLAEQFTKMITSQRGFQANSKIITTSDEMLQGLVNLKR